MAVGVVFLGGRVEVVPVVQVKFLLALAFFFRLLFGLGNGGDEGSKPTAFDDFLSGLAVVIQLPMLPRIFIGGIENRLGKEISGHAVFLFP